MSAIDIFGPIISVLIVFFTLLGSALGNDNCPLIGNRFARWLVSLGRCCRGACWTCWCCGVCGLCCRKPRDESNSDQSAEEQEHAGQAAHRPGSTFFSSNTRWAGFYRQQPQKEQEDGRAGDGNVTPVYGAGGTTQRRQGGRRLSEIAEGDTSVGKSARTNNGRNVDDEGNGGGGDGGDSLAVEGAASTSDGRRGTAGTLPTSTPPPAEPLHHETADTGTTADPLHPKTLAAMGSDGGSGGSKTRTRKWLAGIGSARGGGSDPATTVTGDTGGCMSSSGSWSRWTTARSWADWWARLGTGGDGEGGGGGSTEASGKAQRGKEQQGVGVRGEGGGDEEAGTGAGGGMQGVGPSGRGSARQGGPWGLFGWSGRLYSHASWSQSGGSHREGGGKGGEEEGQGGGRGEEEEGEGKGGRGEGGAKRQEVRRLPPRVHLHPRTFWAFDVLDPAHLVGGLLPLTCVQHGAVA